MTDHTPGGRKPATFHPTPGDTTMKFIAYTFKGRKEVRSTARDTREEAAQELFVANAKLHRVETAVAVQTAEGQLVTFGKDIRSVSRLEAAKALKQTPTTEPAKPDYVQAAEDSELPVQFLSV